MAEKVLKLAEKENNGGEGQEPSIAVLNKERLKMKFNGYVGKIRSRICYKNEAILRPCTELVTSTEFKGLKMKIEVKNECDKRH